MTYFCETELRVHTVLYACRQRVNQYPLPTPPRMNVWGMRAEELQRALLYF